VTAVRCEGLSKRYRADSVQALRGLDLEVPEGSVFGFLGPNGAGKTTTIRILTGLMQPTSGRAWVAGEPVSRGSRKLAALIGCLEQEPRFYPWMTGTELLVFVAELFGATRVEARRRAGELLDMAGLAKAGKRRIGGYSGGMLQRLGVAAAVTGNPRVLFLDEPCSSLDPIGRKDVLEFVGRLRGRTTVFMSTHILSDVERVCDTVGIIDHGRAVTVGRTDDLARRYAPPFLEIEMESSMAAEELERLLRQAGIGHARRDGALVRLPADDLPNTRRAAMSVLAAHDLPLTRMEARRASLEDVFVRLVADGAAQGGAP
jgi:ABC-2 type transport system ATP-binding protein